MSEHQEQKALFQWAAVHERKALFERRLFAIPNQGGSGFNGVRRGMQMKAEGLKADTADIFFAHPVQWVSGYMANGLFIELKDHGKYLRKGQKEFLQEMRKAGYMAFGVRGWERASILLDQYLKGNVQILDMNLSKDLYYGDSGKL